MDIDSRLIDYEKYYRGDINSKDGNLWDWKNIVESLDDLEYKSKKEHIQNMVARAKQLNKYQWFNEPSQVMNIKNKGLNIEVK